MRPGYARYRNERERAEEFGMTLVGFLKADRFNIYAGPQRVV
ncbi:MAG: formate dehydrogenase accessory sulfurtransferase FdhD [Gammaproteobacteria bacterium]